MFGEGEGPRGTLLAHKQNTKLQKPTANKNDAYFMNHIPVINEVILDLGNASKRTPLVLAAAPKIVV